MIEIIALLATMGRDRDHLHVLPGRSHWIGHERLGAVHKVDAVAFENGKGVQDQMILESRRIVVGASPHREAEVRLHLHAGNHELRRGSDVACWQPWATSRRR